MNLKNISFSDSFLIPLLGTLLLVTSCEEVIEIDLNGSTPVIVAEGLIQENSFCRVNLSYTTDYFNSSEPEYIEDATVLLKEDDSRFEYLSYKGKGLYQGSVIRGKADKFYTISVVGNNFEFTSTSHLIPPAVIISIKFEKTEFQRPGDTKDIYSAILRFKDDTKSVNYYLVKFIKNGEPMQNGYSILKDAYYLDYDIIEYSPGREFFELGDTINAKIYSIDKDTYAYYSKLNDLLESGMGGSTAPYNPKSYNDSNILGHFGAYSFDQISVIVK